MLEILPAEGSSSLEGEKLAPYTLGPSCCFLCFHYHLPNRSTGFLAVGGTHQTALLGVLEMFGQGVYVEMRDSGQRGKGGSELSA